MSTVPELLADRCVVAQMCKEAARSEEVESRRKALKRKRQLRNALKYALGGLGVLGAGYGLHKLMPRMQPTIDNLIDDVKRVDTDTSAPDIIRKATERVEGAEPPAVLDALGDVSVPEGAGSTAGSVGVAGTAAALDALANSARLLKAKGTGKAPLYKPVALTPLFERLFANANFRRAIVDTAGGSPTSSRFLHQTPGAVPGLSAMDRALTAGADVAEGSNLFKSTLDDVFKAGMGGVSVADDVADAAATTMAHTAKNWDRLRAAGKVSGRLTPKRLADATADILQGHVRFGPYAGKSVVSDSVASALRAPATSRKLMRAAGKTYESSRLARGVAPLTGGLIHAGLIGNAALNVLNSPGKPVAGGVDAALQVLDSVRGDQ